MSLLEILVELLRFGWTITSDFIIILCLWQETYPTESKNNKCILNRYIFSVFFCRVSSFVISILIFLSSSINERIELKKKLECKPFRWYLKHVYPELLIPTNEGGPGGALKQGVACLDSMGHLLDGNVGLYPCHDTGGNQVIIIILGLNFFVSKFCQTNNTDSNLI